MYLGCKKNTTFSPFVTVTRQKADSAKTTRRQRRRRTQIKIDLTNGKAQIEYRKSPSIPFTCSRVLTGSCFVFAKICLFITLGARGFSRAVSGFG